MHKIAIVKNMLFGCIISYSAMCKVPLGGHYSILLVGMYAVKKWVYNYGNIGKSKRCEKCETIRSEMRKMLGTKYIK